MPAFLVLLTAMGQILAPQLAAPGQSSTLSADSAELINGQKTVHAQGHVMLTNGGLLLRSQSLDYDLEKQTGQASGDLLMVDGNLVFMAQSGSFGVTPDSPLKFDNVILLQKGGVDQASLRAASQDTKGAGKAGRNLILLKADHLERIARGRYVARQLQMTSCDCIDTVPDWSLRSSNADIEPGERSLMWWPTVYVKKVPVLVLPALYLPLSSRRTGLLFPRFTYSNQNGFFFDQPLFITLGESHDLTLSAGWWGWPFTVDPSVIDNPDGTKTCSRTGMQGMHAAAEWRYATSPYTSGQLSLNIVNDRHSDRNQVIDSKMIKGAPRGLRGALSFRHQTDLPNGLSAHADVNLVSDGYYPGDEALDVLNRAPYVRSQAWTGWRGQNLLIAASTGWYQDTNALNTANTVWIDHPEHWFFGRFAPASIQQPLTLSFILPRKNVVGPLHAEFEAAAARFQPVYWTSGRISQDRLELMRVDVASTLSATVLGQGPVHAEVYGTARGKMSSYPDYTQTSWRGRLLTGVWASTELSRPLATGAWRHVIEPRVETRAATTQSGQALNPEYACNKAYADKAYDEFDMCDPSFVQTLVSVRNRLLRRDKGSLVTLDLGQGFDWKTGKFAESFAKMQFTPQYVNTSAAAHYDWSMRKWSSLNASLRLSDKRNDALELRYDRLFDDQGTDPMRAQIDQLFAWRDAEKKAGNRFSQITVGAALAINSWILLRYDTTINTDPNKTTNKDVDDSWTSKFLAHTAKITLGEQDGCWKFDFWASLITGSDNRYPNFGFMLELKNLGSFGH